MSSDNTGVHGVPAAARPTQGARSYLRHADNFAKPTAGGNRILCILLKGEHLMAKKAKKKAAKKKVAKKKKGKR
jgi:hypothetical protein